MKKIQVRTDTRLKDLEDKYTGLYPTTCLSGSWNLGSWNLLPGWNRVGRTCTWVMSQCETGRWRLDCFISLQYNVKYIASTKLTKHANLSQRLIVLSEKYNEIFFLKKLSIFLTQLKGMNGRGRPQEKITQGLVTWRPFVEVAYLSGF